MTRGDDQEVAIAAAAAGAAVVRKKFGGALERFDKGGGDFATEADVEAEQAILEILSNARPGDAVVGEESGQSGASGVARTWLVDPLCGTLNFASGGMAVAVNVALRSGADVTAAAVADPFSGEIFWTDGRAAYVRRADDSAAANGAGSSHGGSGRSEDAGRGDGGGGGGESGGGESGGEAGGGEAGGGDLVLRPSGASMLVDVNLDPPFFGVGNAEARMIVDPEFVGRFRTRVLSTTLALTWVAVGRRAAYVTSGGDLSGSVHFAAGIALCRAAGCVVSALDGSALGPEADGLLVAADQDTHDSLLAILSKPAR